MNRGHGRRQFDIQKPLIKIEFAEEFFKDNEDSSEVVEKATHINGKIKKENTLTDTTTDTTTASALKKNEIIIPVAKQAEDNLKAVPEFEEVFYKKRKLQTHFIRIDYCNPKPSPEFYEPTDKDLQFIKEINEKLPKASRGGNAHEITMQNFASTIEAWEHATEKGDAIPLTKAVNLVESTYSGALKDCASKIYEYWKNLRELYQRPLLRKYLKVVNKDENNPNAAFRFREANKMKTRRAQRNTDADNLEKMRILKQDLDMAITLVGNIRYREMIKLELCELANLKLETSLKEKQDSAFTAKLIERYEETFKNESYLKLKNKMKEYNNNAKKLIDKFNESEKEDSIPTQTPSPFPKPLPIIKPDEELKFDLGSFIATILDESLARDITPESLPNVYREEPIIQQQPPPIVIEKPPPFRTEIPNHHPQKPLVDEKALDRFRLHRRIGRQKRVLLDRIFDEDENSLFSHPRDFYHVEPSQKDLLISPEIAQKFTNNHLKNLYLARFSKFSEICPFGDSEEESEMTESTKMIKNLANNFKMFVKQRRPSNIAS